MTKKLLTASLTIALVAALIGGATMAWLTAKADAPENTFTAGDVMIEAGRKVVTRTQPGNQNDALAPNYGFAANSYEASVSKVDLVNYTEVARYYTAPREPGDPDIEAWRTNRLTMDAQGNAWVLNTGADAIPGRFNPTTGLQGQLVRIQADTDGLANNHEYPDPVLDFGTDDAVQVFDIGGHDDMPRAVAIDADGYIWVGFYKGAYLMKYRYNVATGTLTAVGGPYAPPPGTGTDQGTIRYYDMLFAPDGTLFISSRDSTPSLTPRTLGIWSFDVDTQAFVRETTADPYALLIGEDGTVYASSYDRVLRIRDTAGTWTQLTLTDDGSTQSFRGMAFDGLGRIWITSTTSHTGGNRVYWFDLATEAYDYITLTTGNTPVGIERDAAGIMWVVCRTDNLTNGYLEGFNPWDQSFVAAIQVGPRPYVYRDFIVPGRPWNPGDCDEVRYWVHNTGSKNIRLRAEVSGEWEFDWDWLWENRAALCFTDKDEDLTFEQFQDAVLELPDPVVVTLCEGSEDDWSLEEDGYWYYVGPEDPIAPCTTVQLCFRVCFGDPEDASAAGNEFQTGRYTLTVAFEAAQASNNAPEELWGVDEEELWG